MEETWRCGNCGSDDPTDTQWNTRSRTRYPSWASCRRCYAAYGHHIPWATYLALVARGCGICGALDNLEIDHDHNHCGARQKSCGECVRGMLCPSHNMLVGYYEMGRLGPKVIAELGNIEAYLARTYIQVA